VAARVTLREITQEEGQRLLRIVRRTSGSVVTWRRAQVVLLSAQGMSPPAISEVVFTEPDTVREVIHNFNREGFGVLYPRYKGGRPPTFTLPKRQEIKRIALTDPAGALTSPFRRGRARRAERLRPACRSIRGRRPTRSGSAAAGRGRPPAPCQRGAAAPSTRTR